ncbi:DUF4349 domain-containing protein [Mycobacterium talmoniae]|uniref:DUF4349 domain-containing protein n=1 Tax=Mycobacterium talmoniae TaxID=1858794 RepID=A0A1S1MHP8_9MYCO|nr:MULTISPECIES: DUF4349 domain-containing protein [Mycobacterium]OHU82408.1 hypothetical protein BKN37_26945 [Mycobacterium talmoniae]TDH49462.1 DUF4349 domain-containing protein [Mycobacterium eburneum]
MTTHHGSASRALLLGVAALLLVVVAGCAGQRPVSGGTNPAPAAPASPSNQPQQRDIVTTGSLGLTVADVDAATNRLVELTAGLGGRIDDRTERSSGRSRTAELTVRVPSPKVDEFLQDTKQLGDVTSVSLKHEDVTTGRVDLDARIAALQTSVDRLTALMKAATSTADLLQAEDALSKRQADLDSLRAQRTQLGDQISFATITVTVSAEAAAPSTGFVASVRHGWHALVSATHGAIAVVGFLLPWVPVLLLIAGGVMVLRRRIRRRP